MAKRQSKKPTHALEELEVREVSLVDRPANQRKFLIVKREDGGDLSIAITEAEEMAKRSAVAASEARPATVIEIESVDKLDPLGLLDVLDDEDTDGETPEDETPDTGAGGDDDPAPDESEDGVEAITKATTLKVTSEALTQLMGVVNAINKNGGAVSEEHAMALQSIAKTLAPDLSATTPASEDARAETTDALTRLMSAVTLIKALDDEIETLPGAVTTQLEGIASTLNGVAAAQSNDTADTADEERPQLTVFKTELPDGDLDLIIKRGAKMQNTRLSTLRRAVEMLGKLVKELEGDGKAATKKSEDATIDTAALVSQVTASVDASIAKVVKEVSGAMNTLREEIAAVSKRVDDVDGSTPDGNADGDDEEETSGESDGAPVKKSQGTSWENILGTTTNG